jgi:hypothetical protein
MLDYAENPNLKRSGKSRRGKSNNDKKCDDNRKNQDGMGNKESTGKKQAMCFKCKGNHYISQCPELKRNKESNNERIAAATFKASNFTTFQVNTVGC